MRSPESAWMRRVYSPIFGSLSSSSALGGRGGVAATQTGGCGGVGVGLGSGPGPGPGPGPGLKLGPGVGVGDGPPTKEKSDVIDDDSHGTCSRFVAAMTPAWVLRNASSALVPGLRVSRSSSVTNRL